MAAHRDADLIILGGGLSGLALAACLARSGARFRVLIIEPREGKAPHRTWCFFAPQIHPLSGLVEARFEAGLIAFEDGPGRRISSPGLLYQKVSGEAVTARAAAAIEGAPNIRLHQGVRAYEVRKHALGLAVDTSGGTLIARHVVDTRPPAQTGSARPVLFQAFAGKEVETGRLDLVPELMGAIRQEGPDLLFDYVIPLGPGRARAESVRWSFAPVTRNRLDEDFNAMVERRGWQAGSGALSYGALPTGLQRERAGPLAGLTRAAIGTGGWRPGAGQAVLGVERWAGLSTARMMSGAPPAVFTDTTRLQDAATAQMVARLSRAPEHTEDFLRTLLIRLPAPALMRVMSARAGLRDAARISMALSRSPQTARRNGATDRRLTSAG